MSQSDRIREIFQNHYGYYKQTGTETIKQQAGQVEQVSSDYEGRVIYELIQNAFDKAGKHILVKVGESTLYIANDGTKFSYTADYNYQEGGTNRGDFQSLCSISTSTKKASVNIGNKGVGFKSGFSIAKEGYINVYTKGEIFANTGNFNEQVNFRIYESFREVATIPLELEQDIQELLKRQIPEVQKGHPNRGVPGYYYPLLFDKTPSTIEKLFQDGFVTVVEIPVRERSTIINLLIDFKRVHFDFISLKYSKEFEVKFQYDEQEISRQVRVDAKSIFWAMLDNKVTEEVSKDAGIELKDSKVAISFRGDNGGYLYNYLPTTVESPFRYVDFHADFHTTVDRKGINFEGAVGAYNKILLTACLELYWSVLNSSLEYNCKVQLNLRYIRQRKYHFKDFNWNLIDCNNTKASRIANINILNTGGNQFENASQLFAILAKNFFEADRTDTDYDTFYRNVQNFIHGNATNSSQYTKPIREFKKRLAQLLLEHNVPLVPGIRFSREREILYKKPDDKKLDLPEFLGIAITSYEIDKVHCNYFKQQLQIKDFNDYNEILKHYKQCSFSGEYSTTTMTEVEQISLLQSLFKLFIARREKSLESTHRFTTVFTAELRSNNRSLNRANFNIATLFIKTQDDKFKPAQLCTIEELDPKFLSSITEDKPQKTQFLTFLGVSMHKKTIFADTRIYERLKNGLYSPPALLSREADQHTEINGTLLEYINIIEKDALVHPALVNENGYNFLHKFSNKKLNGNFETLLVKKYSQFPEQYRSVLKSTLEQFFNSNKTDIIRLYQSIFHMYSQDNQYLILEHGRLQWKTDTSFLIVSSKSDFELLIQRSDLKVLCYYSGQDLPDKLVEQRIKKLKGSITFDQTEELAELKSRLEERMIYLLVSISYSTNSKLNYLIEDENINDLQNTLRSVRFLKADNLKQEIKFDNVTVASLTSYAYAEPADSTLYFSKTSTNSTLAMAIAEYFFSNHALKDIIELTIFHKTLEDLYNEHDQTDILIIKSKWKKDYEQKFEAFQLHLTELFQIEIENLWYIYDENHRSKALIKLENENRLHEMKLTVENLKNEPTYLNYFDEFQIQINYEHIEKMAAELLSLVDKYETHKGTIDEELTKIKSLSRKIGSEDELLNMKHSLMNRYNLDEVSVNKEQLGIHIGRLELDRKINMIFDEFHRQKHKVIKLTQMTGADESPIPINHTKKIYQGSLTSGDVEQQELTGANGEEQVLQYFIRKFLENSTEDRAIGINETYSYLESHLGNDKHKKFRDDCLQVIDNDRKLTRCLIPFFYIALHHKYAYFDLIVYTNKTPTLIEVKSTRGNHNNFHISSAEMNIARRSSNYEIVRVTKDAMIFLGNPIRAIDDRIKLIKGESFTLTPKNYEFKIKDENVTHHFKEN